MMRLLRLLLLPAVIFLILAATHRTTGVEVNDTIPYNKTELEDVEKTKMLEPEEKQENVIIENFMVRERTPLASSPMSPIYERTEFMVLSAGIVLYLALMVSVGTVLIMCCMCAKSRVKINEDEDSQKKKVDDKTEE